MAEELPKFAQINVGSDRGVNVTIALDENDTTWFRMANALILNGLFRKLRNESRHAITVMACLAAKDGMCMPERISDIRELAGISETSWRRAKDELLELSLIQEVREGAYRLFPGCDLWSRARTATTRPATGGGHTATGGGRVTRPTATGGGSTATGGGPPLGIREREQDSVGADSSSREHSIPAPADTERVAVVALLRKEGFGDKDIERFGSTVSFQQLRGYIANADEIERRGKPWRSSRRAYLAGAMRDGYGLYANVERQMTRDRAPELREKLEDIVLPRLDESREDHRAILEVFGTSTGTLERGGVTARELDSLGADEVFDLLLVRAKAKAAARRCRR